jgi:hypothetical protein
MKKIGISFKAFFARTCISTVPFVTPRISRRRLLSNIRTIVAWGAIISGGGGGIIGYWK